MTKPKAGAPTKYDPDHTPKLAGWMARAGLIDAEIAGELGIDTRTLYRWKRQHPELCHALKESKAVVDHMVEDALLKRAMGFEYTERKEVTDADGKPISITEATRTIPPDVTACIFWLKNRKPKEWRDKQQMDMKFTGGVLVVPDQADQLPDIRFI